jgi:hypothetical protein
MEHLTVEVVKILQPDGEQNPKKERGRKRKKEEEEKDSSSSKSVLLTLDNHKTFSMQHLGGLFAGFV